MEPLLRPKWSSTFSFCTKFLSIELSTITPRPELEINTYHLLSPEELDQRLHEPEAVLQKASRLRIGIGVVKNESEGWRLTLEAAISGHPVALALCFHHGKGADKDFPRSVELYRQSAERGHPNGCCTRTELCAELCSD